MTIEQFKNNWQPQMDGYARFSFNLDLKELVQQIRADAIEEFKTDMLNKICFEEKWLMKSKSDNADTDIMFSALKTFCESISEKLKDSK